MASSLLQFVLFVASLLIAVPVVWSQTQMTLLYLQDQNSSDSTGKLATIRFINNNQVNNHVVNKSFWEEILTQIYTCT